jgi:hypothetical protein
LIRAIGMILEIGTYRAVSFKKPLDRGSLNISRVAFSLPRCNESSRGAKKNQFAQTILYNHMFNIKIDPSLRSSGVGSRIFLGLISPFGSDTAK